MTKRRITAEIKKELDRIQAQSKTGRLHWQDVVSAARNKTNVLHGYFDFDKERAMEAYLQQQAEDLIGRYATVIITNDGDKVRTRNYVSLSIDRQSGGGYRAIVDVLSDEDLKAQLLADAFADLAAFKERYKKLQELGEVFEAIQKVEKRRGTGKPKPRRGTARAKGTDRDLRV
jgi:hypothetical protein